MPWSSHIGMWLENRHVCSPIDVQGTCWPKACAEQWWCVFFKWCSRWCRFFMCFFSISILPVYLNETPKTLLKGAPAHARCKIENRFECEEFRKSITRRLPLKVTWTRRNIHWHSHWWTLRLTLQRTLDVLTQIYGRITIWKKRRLFGPMLCFKSCNRMSVGFKQMDLAKRFPFFFNKYLFANFGVDRAESEPPKVFGK